MNRRKPIVGEKLILRSYYRHPDRHEDTEITVTKVGRKYWEAEREYAPGRKLSHGPFTVATWQWGSFNANVNNPVFIAESPQQLDDREARKSLIADLREQFRWGHIFEKFSLEKLRKLQALIADETI
jgi:hypothetical protein